MIELKKDHPRKIHIIGSVGSGKTTLARNLSMKLKIPHYELDNVVWKRSKPSDIKRTDEERDQILSRIIQSDGWIVEGAHYSSRLFTIGCLSNGQISSTRNLENYNIILGRILRIVKEEVLYGYKRNRNYPIL